MAWNDCYGNRPVMIREAATLNITELREAIMDIAGDRGEINRKRLGKWISRHAGRIVDGLKFEKDSGKRSAEAWYVKTVTLDSAISDTVPPKTVMQQYSQIVSTVVV